MFSVLIALQRAHVASKKHVKKLSSKELSSKAQGRP